MGSQTIFLIKAKLLVLLLIFVSFTSLYAQGQGQLRYVDPLIGSTKSAVQTSWGGNGGTYPGAVAPSGNIQLSPETRVTGAKGYDHMDSSIYFFSCMKHYSGFPEGSSGHLFVMPVDATVRFEAGKYNRSFSHDNEVAQPGYYKVKFTDNNTVVEATAATRTGMFQFTFAANVKPVVFIGDAGEVSFVNKREVRGSANHTILRFSEDYLNRVWVKGGCLVTFKSSAVTKVITLKLSSSTVDFAGTAKNLSLEGLQDFDQMRKATTNQWAKALAVVDIVDPDQTNKTVFYTALYHSLLIPWLVSDADGRYRGADGEVYQAAGKDEYGGFSPWDTFRSLHPLLTLLYPAKQRDMIVSMLHVYQQTGHLPTESMTGNHAVPIIVDSYLKGIQSYDQTLAYTAMKKNLLEAPFVQGDMEIYHQLNYVPFSKSESVTRTVEYAYDDWALSQYAKLVMHNQKDEQLLGQRGLNYRNLFAAEDRFMLPRKENVFKRDPGMSGYKEGNKWIYTYFVPQNGKDLVNLLGGDQDFSARLDSALTHGVILYDNETVLHLPYLFNVARHPELTQKWSRYVTTKRFSATPGGLPGNDDLGSMSSAYIFNALGIFPICPGRPLYAIGSPLFQSVTLHLDHDKKFVINSKNQALSNPYVQSLTVNGVAYEQLILPHTTLINGGSMEYVMGKQVNPLWPKDKNPLMLSETKQDVKIALIDYSFSKTKVVPDEQFWLRFKLSNKGSLGTKSIKVYLNGVVYQSKNLLVPTGKTVVDSISCRLYPLGKVTLSLRPENGTLIEVVSPANPLKHPFTVSNVQLKPVVLLNKDQRLSYQVKNLAGTPEIIVVPVTVNDSVLYTDQVKLLPGETKTISHQFNALSEGLKILKADTVQVKYKVYHQDTSSLLMDLSLVTTRKDHIMHDRSGFDNHGHIIGGIAGGDPIPGPILLGDSCFIAIPNAASLDHLEESITMMAWVKPEAEEKGLVDLLTKGDSHVLQTGDNKTLTFFAGGWGRGDLTVKLPENWKQQWHHIAGVCQGDVLWLYIDGKLSATSKVDGTVNLSVNNTWQIGRNEEFPSERIFHGYMDKVKIYEQALSADDIAVIVNREREQLVK